MQQHVLYLYHWSIDYCRIEKDPGKGETVDEVSDVSSNELSGPEDGECESGEEEEVKKPRKVLLSTPPPLNHPVPFVPPQSKPRTCRNLSENVIF